MIQLIYLLYSRIPFSIQVIKVQVLKFAEEHLISYGRVCYFADCRRSASKSTSSLLDASSMPSSSYSCCGTSTSSSAIWSNSNSLYPEVASSAVSPLMQPPMTSNNQQQLPAISSGSFTNTNSQATLTATTTPQKTKIKVNYYQSFKVIRFSSRARISTVLRSKPKSLEFCVMTTYHYSLRNFQNF